MNERPEIIGSMPSVPQEELRPPKIPQKPKSGNVGNFIGFFLWAICLLVFPNYARTDELGTGIFYGMGLTVLLMLFAVLLHRGGAVLSGKNKPPKALTARPEAGKPQRIRRLNGVLFGIVLLMLGVFLLTAPNLGALSSIAGLFVLIVGISVTFLAVFSGFRNRRISTAKSRSEFPTREQQRLNAIKGVIVFLLLGVCLLVFPLTVSLNALSRGIFYGVGLVVLLIAIIGLSSSVATFMTAAKSPEQ